MPRAPLAGGKEVSMAVRYPTAKPYTPERLATLRHDCVEDAAKVIAEYVDRMGGGIDLGALWSDIRDLVMDLV